MGLVEGHAVQFRFWPTSVLAGLPTVPQIKEVRFLADSWNLSNEAREILSGLEGVKITFVLLRSFMKNFSVMGADITDPPETKFWKSLPFVTLEEIGD